MPDYGLDLEFGIFPTPDASRHHEVLELAQLADVLGSVLGIAAATAEFAAWHVPGQDAALFGAIFLGLAVVAAVGVPAGQRIRT